MVPSGADMVPSGADMTQVGPMNIAIWAAITTRLYTPHDAHWPCRVLLDCSYNPIFQIQRVRVPYFAIFARLCWAHWDNPVPLCQHWRIPWTPLSSTSRNANKAQNIVLRTAFSWLRPCLPAHFPSNNSITGTAIMEISYSSMGPYWGYHVHPWVPALSICVDWQLRWKICNQ